ncbi:GH25 family lysozyme [Paenibacillus harenae]|uniref:GH25 family lysozyme n=1 Tax=Paenibacillus harenae TaxID=306543 RepID=UPI0003F631C8|nr:GH25 family lysozyme [Paenibacillus harenae]
MNRKKIVVIAAAMIILLGFLEYKGYIWHNSIFAMNYEVRGLDVSPYQGAVDWGKVAESGKYQFVYMKATEGHDFTDNTFNQNWEGAKAGGMLVGTYHFFSSRSTGEQQANHFISLVPVEEASLPPVIDLEISLTHDWIRDIFKYPALKKDQDWVLWQYCNRGRIAGIDAYVDINVFNSDQAAFEERFT